MSQDQPTPLQPRRSLPLDRYVISVDGQRKIGFLDRSAAEAAADKLRQAFPVLTVQVRDEEEAVIRERIEPAR